MAILPHSSHTNESNSTWTLVLSVVLVLVSLAAIELLAKEQDSLRTSVLFLSAASLALVFGAYSARQDYLDSKIATIILGVLMVAVAILEHFLRRPEEAPSLA